MTWRLKDLESSNTFEINNGDTIGRKDGHHTFPSNERMSKIHAEFSIEEDKIYIKDLNSRNGTLLNGQRIIPDARVRIKRGDQIFAGNSKFVLEDETYNASSEPGKSSGQINSNHTMSKPLRNEFEIERIPGQGIQTISSNHSRSHSQTNIMSEKMNKTIDVISNANRSKIISTITRTIFLSIPTMGIYSAWGKVQIRNYLWNSTSINGYQFEYHGTPKQILIGWLNLLIFALVIFLGYSFTQNLINVDEVMSLALKSGLEYWFIITYTQILFLLGFTHIINQTSLRNISFRYSNNELTEHLFDIIKYSFLTILSCGVYYPVMSIRLFERKWNNTYYGKEPFKVKIDAGDYYMKWWKGAIITVITFGLYSPWFALQMHKYRLSCLNLKGATITSSLEAEDLLFFILSRFFWFLFTLGLSGPYIYSSYINFLLSHMHIHGKLDFEMFARDLKKEQI